MKKAVLLLSFIILLFAVPAFAQNGDDDKEQVPFDILLEDDAKHNLDVAWQYFKLKKAYKAVLVRMEETIAAHPTFSKADEVLYLAGMSSYYLSIDKGKQKIDLQKLPEEDREKYTDENLRETAAAYLTELVDDHPESKYADKAKKTLKQLEKSDK
jgi:outer membrane protein assembly factor BamD (BamD/ComL family)